MSLQEFCAFWAIIIVLFSISDIKASCDLVAIQASSPLQVKYADGELERLGEL